MTVTYQPVPVDAFGRRFRSTTEARWAAFFESMGLPYEYEAETFDLGHGLGWYVPDFWLPTLLAPGRMKGWWIEVKPGKPTILNREWDRALAVARLTEQPVAIATGFGSPVYGNQWVPGALTRVIPDPGSNVQAELGFWACICGAAGLLQRDYWYEDHGCRKPQNWHYTVEGAYAAGRSFRAGRQ